MAIGGAVKRPYQPTLTVHVGRSCAPSSQRPLQLPLGNRLLAENALEKLF